MQLRTRALETILLEKGYIEPAAIDVLIETYEKKIEIHQINSNRCEKTQKYNAGFRHG